MSHSTVERRIRDHLKPRLVVDEVAIQLRFEALDPVMDERSRRRFAAAEACAAGRGGIALRVAASWFAVDRSW